MKNYVGVVKPEMQASVENDGKTGKIGLDCGPPQENKKHGCLRLTGRNQSGMAAHRMLRRSPGGLAGSLFFGDLPIIQKS